MGRMKHSACAPRGRTGRTPRRGRRKSSDSAKLAVIETALEHLNQGFCIFDRQHKLVICNDRYINMYRLPAELKRPGTPLRLILERRFDIGVNDSEDREACIRDWTQAVSAKTTTKTMVRFKDGRVLCRDHLPLSDGGFVSIFEDVTEGLRTANDLDRMQSFLDSVIANIPAMVVVKEVRERRCLLVNKSAEEFLGISREEMIGKTVYDFLPRADAELIDRQDDAALQARDDLTIYQTTAHTRRAGLRQLNAKRVVIRDQQGLPRFLMLVAEDVTDRLETERALDRTQSFLDTIIENVPAILFVKDVQGRYTLVNRAAEKFFGAPRDEMIGKNAGDIYVKAQADDIAARDAEALQSPEALTINEHSLDTPGSGLRHVISKRLVLRDPNGNPQSMLVLVEDQTERLEREGELDRARTFLDAIIENIPMSITVKSAAELRYRTINRAAEKLLGMPRDKVIGAKCFDLFPADLAGTIHASDREALRAGGEVLTHESSAFSEPGAERIRAVRRLAINGADGQPQFLLTMGEDITERKRAIERIEFMAHHDPLTQLPNRATFHEHLARMFGEASNSGKGFAVLCIDVDRFKEVNDVFGHAVGDEFLKAVSERLRRAAEGAFLARLGGDEFTLITACGPQPALAEALVERMFEMASGDVEIQGHQIRIGLSVGVSMYPADATDASTLLSNADTALYRAKKEGRGTVRFYDVEMDRRTREHHALQHDLRLGIGRDELVLHYQPQARMGGEIIGFEALIRWLHPKRGLISPGSFIPAAEENGLIVAIGEWTLREACREAASWGMPLQVALNLSPVQFRHGDLPSLVHRVLLETGLNPNRLELEITESALIGDFARALSILRRLKALGVRIAMDDFGTGYSSLSYLQSFPFDKIKIDRSFIMNLMTSPQSATIVRAVIGLARGLDLPVIAEGVETQDQLAFLAREACDEVQGYLIGRPRPIDDYAALVGAAPATAQPAASVG
ncbi:PAS domain S-box-containing protein/diguanylate cyclase (GGDEF) domain-containing protein [Rhizobiales bacterium GAS113]|nr:PAS domain S-box-containing protein/diguanylate cyclase (GGDEF) domain-containing protein [Rhizobiales bacterium GAS113]